ncbi:MAG: zinc-ribbon domain-containing protein [Eubacterium sp.]
MRCRNCGTENDDNRYICENCGSPLYDEDNINENEKTQTFKAVNNTDDYARETEVDRSSRTTVPYNSNNSEQPNGTNNDKSTDKKSIIVIAVLVVVLVAIIASIVAIASGRKADKADENGTSELTKISTTVSTTSNTTERETTTEEETETTTEKTTTAATLWIINTSSSGGGKTQGDGKYKNGDKVTLTAIADDGYVFDGWYSNGIKVSNETKYTFTANENASFSAVFNPVETTAPSTEAPTDITEISEAPSVVFGE